MNSDGECVLMDSENQLCRDQKGNCRSHGSRWRYKCYKVSCQNNRVEIINASKIDHIGAQEDLMILKKKLKLTVDIIIIFFWQNAVLKIRKVILLQVMNVTYPFISSPKRKFQVSFSDLIKIKLNLSLLCRCRYKLVTFSSSFPKPLGRF